MVGVLVGDGAEVAAPGVAAAGVVAGAGAVAAAALGFLPPGMRNVARAGAAFNIVRAARYAANGRGRMAISATARAVRWFGRSKTLGRTLDYAFMCNNAVTYARRFGGN